MKKRAHVATFVPQRPYDCGILLRFTLCSFFASTLLTAATPGLTATITSSTVPAGGTAQIQIFLAAPQAIVSGEIILDLDPALFGDILSVDVFSATGDQLGVVTLQGRHLDATFTSQTGGIGRLPGLPILVASVPVLTSAPTGTQSSITFQPGAAQWKVVQGSQFTVNVLPGTLTVGGDVSVKDVTPGGGPLPAGALVKIEGTGFTADTLVAIDGVSLASTTFVSAQEIDLKLGAPADLTGKPVRMGGRLGAGPTFYSALRANLIHRPDTGPLATILPILPSQLYAAANAGSFVVSQAGIAMENPTQNPVDVTIESQSIFISGPLVSQIVITLPPGALYIDSGRNLGGGATDRAQLYIFPASPIRMAVIDSRTARLVTPVPIPTTQVSVIQDGFAPIGQGFPLTWHWVVGTATPPPKIVAADLFPALTPFSVSATAADGGSWLSVSPSAGVTCALYYPQTIVNCPASSKVTVTLDPSRLSLGVHQGTLTFTTTQGLNPQPAIIPVVFSVEAQPQIFLDHSSFDLGSAPAAGMITDQVNVTSNADPLPFSVSANQPAGESWLTVSSNRATTPAILTISANLSGLSPGKYTGSIAVTAAGATQNISVSLEVMSLAILQFSFQTGQAPPSSQTIAIPTAFDPFTVSVQTSDSGPWLAVMSNGLARSVTVSVNPSGLSTGTYHGAVIITSAASGPVQVPVTLTIYNGLPPQVTVSPTSLSFTAPMNTAATPQTVSVTTGNLPAQFSISTSTPDWLGASPLAAAITPGSATVSAAAIGLVPGSYHGTLTVTAPPGSANSTSIPVTFNVTPALPPLPQAGTVPVVTSVVSGASQTVASLAPGEIVTLFGQNIGPSIPAGFAFGMDGKVATELNGTEVLFDGVPAPLLYSSATQANVIVPYEVSGATTVQLRINGTILSTIAIPISPAAPGLFTLDSTGLGAAAVLNPDNSINTATNPAVRGSTLQIYATGAGILTPPGLTGEITGADAKRPVLAVKATIGGIDAPVSYAASAPDAVSGLLQVNVFIPTNVSPGSAVPLVLTIGTSPTQDGVTIAVK